MAIMFVFYVRDIIETLCRKGMIYNIQIGSHFSFPIFTFQFYFVNNTAGKINKMHCYLFRRQNIYVDSNVISFHRYTQHDMTVHTRYNLLKIDTTFNINSHLLTNALIIVFKTFFPSFLFGIRHFLCFSYFLADLEKIYVEVESSAETYHTKQLRINDNIWIVFTYVNNLYFLSILCRQRFHLQFLPEV